MISICSQSKNLVNREVKIDLSIKKITSDEINQKINSFDNKIANYIKKQFLLKLKHIKNTEGDINKNININIDNRNDINNGDNSDDKKEELKPSDKKEEKEEDNINKEIVSKNNKIEKNKKKHNESNLHSNNVNLTLNSSMIKHQILPNHQLFKIIFKIILQQIMIIAHKKNQN